MNENEMIILNKNIPINNQIHEEDQIKIIKNKHNINNHYKENIKFSIIKEEEIKEQNDDKSKEFLSNSPFIYMLFKIFLLSEGQITRILLQLGDLYFASIITNIYLEIMLILLTASAESNTFIKIYAFVSSLIFLFIFRIIVTISYWELYQLKWFDLNPFNSITDLLNLKLKAYMIRNIYIICHIIFGVLFWLFIIGLLTMSSKNGIFLDIINLIIFIIIPMSKFLLVYLAYIYICFKNWICNDNNNNSNDNLSEKNPFRYWLKLNDLINKGTIKIGNLSSDDISKNKTDINFFEKIFCKEILFQIKIFKGKKLSFSLKTLFKIFFTLLSFIYIIYLFAKKGATAGGVFFLIFVYLISLIISIQLSTPLWISNAIYRWYLKIIKRYDRKYQIKCRLFNEKFSAFKVLDILPLVVSIFLWLFFLMTIITFHKNESHFYCAKDKIHQKGEFKLTDWEREFFSEKNNIENAICFTDINGLSLLKISSLAFAAYMNDTENIVEYYKKSIFKENTEEITEMKFLNLYSKYSMILMTNIDISGQKPITVFAIQASVKRLDYWLDLEIFCSSALFTLTRILTINKLESLTSRAITWLLTLPIRLLEKLTLFSKYIESLKDVDEEIKKINGERNIIFTGHSLGGGMAKYLGLKYHKKNVGISGPGITPLEYKFYKEDNYYKYFKSNLIDIVPDNDIIPRIERTGGIEYRVICEKDYFDCHKMKRILCQMGAICRREDLTGDLCMSIFGRDEYKEMRELAGIKSEIPKDYD